MSDEKKPDRFFGGDEDWRGSDLGSSMHTALRKACDSSLTSIAYNLVDGCDTEWAYLLRKWERALRLPSEFDASTAASLGKSMRTWCEANGGIMGDDYPNPEEREALSHEGWEEGLYRALVQTFALCDTSEWEGILSYLFYPVRNSK